MTRYKNDECSVCGGSKRAKRGITFRQYKTCSDECARVQRVKAHESYRTGKCVPCVVCGEPVYQAPSAQTQRAHCKECVLPRLPRAYREPKTKPCPWCNKQFVGPRTYCSDDCLAASAAHRAELRPSRKKPSVRRYESNKANFYTRKDKAEVVERLTAKQHGKCAICGCNGYKLGNGKVGLVLDHDHETGEARAMLCSKCNAGLGMFGDSPERLAAAAKYAQRWVVIPLRLVKG